MTTFVLCMFFSVHPDFWLADERIDTPLAKILAMYVENLRKSLARDYARIAKDPKDAHVKDVIKRSEQTARIIENNERDIQQERRKRRVELFFNLPMKKR